MTECRSCGETAGHEEISGCENCGVEICSSCWNEDDTLLCRSCRYAAEEEEEDEGRLKETS